MAILVAQESGSKLQDIGTKMHYFQASFVSNESLLSFLPHVRKYYIYHTPVQEYLVGIFYMKM